MSILNKLTITSLKLNKKRTAVTIIGIILATALITAVSGLATSFRRTMIEEARQTDGNYHYQFQNVPVEELKYFKNNRNVESYYITQNIGYSYLKESKNEYKPYLYLMAYNEKAFKDSSIKLVEGRMPQNENEIVISNHIITNGKVNYKVGDKLSIDVGKREGKDGVELYQNNPFQYHDDSEKKLDAQTGAVVESKTETKSNENIMSTTTKTYTIVGIVERPNRTIEPYSAPGYSIITYLDESNLQGKVNFYALYTKEALSNRYDITSHILGISEGTYRNSEQGRKLTNEELQELEKARYVVNENDSLLSYEAFNLSSSNLSMIYNLCIIVIGIIIVTSIFCIRNSFAISITEKKKQYGMLASVGATSKQIRKNVFYEAFILSVIGIPLGVLGGMFAVFVLLKIIEIILSENLNEMQFVFEIPWFAIVLAVSLSIITIFLSARKSAKRAGKVSPIEAIRANEDIKIKAKKLKTPKIISKLFGIGGEIAHKTLKRNQKKYRTTVISIVVSVSIFIAMSSFMNYAFKTADVYYGQKDYNIMVYTENKEKDEKLQEISQIEGIHKFSLQKKISVRTDIENIKFSEDGKVLFPTSSGKRTSFSFQLLTLGKEEYERYLKELGLSYEKAKDKVILIDDAITYIQNQKGNSVQKRIQTFDYQPGDKIEVKYMGKEMEKNMTLEIIKVTDQKPMGLKQRYQSNGVWIVSEEWLEKNGLENEYDIVNLYIDCNDADQIEENAKKIDNELYINNTDATARANNALWLVIAIFLYGFITVISLIGITNIFNTITTNMELRSKEFANLKSIGMTTKEFNRMIRLESIFYGTKSLIIGVPIGIGLSYAIYKAFAESEEMGFIFPTSGVIISVLAVFLLVAGIMKFSLNKINKQNIIETIRKDNI